MTTPTMTKAIADKLREPFKPTEIGKLPRIWCKHCRDAQFKNCKDHQKIKCEVCKNSITSAHLHLDYVGHAEITDRLLQVDPSWTWEPVAMTAEGLPLLDKEGGLWIRLTVAGVTRMGYGDAEGKRGPSATKEAIGDALRNAAMRFGVGLDLWGAKFEREAQATGDEDGSAQQPAERQTRKAEQRGATEDSAVRMVEQAQHRKMHALWREIGQGGDEHRDERLRITGALVKRPELQSSAELTYDEAELVIGKLTQKRDHDRRQAAAKERELAGAAA